MQNRRRPHVACKSVTWDNADIQAFLASALFLDPRPEFRYRGALVNARDTRSSRATTQWPVETSPMGHSKPKPVGPSRAVCPVCRTTTYSLGGIHPQCAVLQSDKLIPRPKVEAAKPKVLTQWTKHCPRCKRQLPARRIACDCGHSFQPQPTSKLSD
jgi:hypothetical protein